MKQIASLQLIEELQSAVREMIARVHFLQQEDPGYLLEQPAQGKWSVIQVLEHLNSYGRYYLPAFKQAMTKEKPAKKFFKPGWLGNYFTKIMLPGEQGTIHNKMKAFKNHQPSYRVDAQPVIHIFLEQQQELLSLLEQAKQKDIGDIRIPISISRWIKLKMGDTFRFLIAHQQRHFVQIENALDAVKHSTGKSPAIHLAN